MKGDGVTEVATCEKSKKLHGDLVAKTPYTSYSDCREFKASKVWFEKFYKRSGIHSVVRHNEAVSSDQDYDEKFVGEFAAYLWSECCLPQKVFNCDEGPMKKKVPNKIMVLTLILNRKIASQLE